jgi:cell division protein FtsB
MQSYQAFLILQESKTQSHVMNKILPSATFLVTVFASIIFGVSAYAQQTGALQLISIDQSAKIQNAEHAQAYYLDIDTQLLEDGALKSGSEFWVETAPGNEI